MEIYIIRDGKELGPLSEEATKTLLNDGSVQTGDLAWCPGMSDWGPLSEVLKPAAVVSPAPPAAEESSAEASDQHLAPEPATDRQKALFSFLGIAFSPDLTKGAASVMLNDATEDPKNSARLQQWNEDRLKLHPELFATEIQARKENRAHHFFDLCQTEGAGYFTNITKAHCQVLVGFLDVKFPNWDARQDEAAAKFFYPAIAEKFPQLVQRQWWGKFHYSEGRKSTAKLAGQTPTGKLKKTKASPLAAVVRGVVFGVLILGVLYLVQRLVRTGAGRATPAAQTASVAPKPAEIARPTQTEPAVDAAAPIDPPKPSSPSEPSTPAPHPGANPSPMAAGSAPPTASGEPGTSPMAMATAPMTSLPGSEPPVPVAPPPATLPAPATMPNASPEPSPTPPATVPEPARNTAARTSLLLTKPIEIPSPYGSIKLGVGTPLKLLARQGNSVKVGYLNNVFTVPVTSTDLGEGDSPAPAP